MVDKGTDGPHDSGCVGRDGREDAWDDGAAVSGASCQPVRSSTMASGCGTWSMIAVRRERCRLSWWSRP
jgi:hypothetical protein